MNLDKSTSKQVIAPDKQYENFGNIIDSCSNVTICDKNGFFLYANDGFCKMFKTNTKDLLGVHLNSILSSSSVLLKNKIQSYINKGITITKDLSFNTFDNEEIWLRTTINPIFDDSDNVKELVIFYNDFSNEISSKAQKDLKLALMNRNDQLTNVYENNIFVMFLVDIDMEILKYTNQCLEQFDINKDEIEEMTFYDLVSDDSKSIFETRIKSWKDNGIFDETVIWLKKNFKESFPCIVKFINIYDLENKLIGVNIIITNLSEIYYAQKEIEELKIKRISDISKMGARIAHDVLNPISIIHNSLEFLTNEENLNKNNFRQDYLKMMKRASDRILFQISSVLQFLGTTPSYFTEHSMNNILQNAVNRTEISKEIKFTFPEKDLKIVCDFEKMIVLFVNLFVNAIDAIEQEGSIIIRTAESQDDIIIDIIDSGSGIPKEVLPLIFEPLFSTKQHGTGLGLPCCKNIIEQHAGEISIDGFPTKVKIKLPKNRKQNKKGFEQEFHKNGGHQ